MNETNRLAEHFEQQRPHLRAVAYRMLGSGAEADDAVQDAWLRLQRSDSLEVDNLGGWLTTVVTRLCLDKLRARKSRPEHPWNDSIPEQPARRRDEADHDTELANSVGVAMLVVLDRLAPAERVAFVLHDMFDLPFEDISIILERSEESVRQLASRARRRVRGNSETASGNLARQHELVEAFLAASRNSDYDALLTMLAPDVRFHADEAAARLRGPGEARGAEAVAATFKGRARNARPILADGEIAVAVAPAGRLLLVLKLSIHGDRIADIEAVGDPERLGRMDLGLP